MHVTIVNHREADRQIYQRIHRYIDYQSGHAINLFAPSDGRWPGRSAAPAPITIGSSPLLRTQSIFDSQTYCSAKLRVVSPKQRSIYLKASEPPCSLLRLDGWLTSVVRRLAWGNPCRSTGSCNKSETENDAGGAWGCDETCD
jgi:hypothetical protein